MTHFATLSLRDGSVVETESRDIGQSDIGNCPQVILLAEHYREDGSCKCDNADEREMMIREWGYTEDDFS